MRSGRKDPRRGGAGLSRLAALAALLAACASAKPPASLSRAEALERRGDDEGALAAYEQAMTDCQDAHRRRERQRWCAEAARGRAETLGRLGRLEEAALAFESLQTGMGWSSAGRLWLELRQDERAYVALWKAVIEHPQSAGADFALQRIVFDGRRRNARELYDVLRHLYPRLVGTAISDDVLMAMAKIALEDLGARDDARAALDALVARHPESPLRDDALWLGATLAEEAGDYAGAAARLKDLLATREVSLLVGSYFSEHLDDAQLRLGVLLREHLGRPADAARAFSDLPRDYPDSILRDDALWELAVTWEALGRRKEACAATSRLARDFPDSKHLLENAPSLRTRLSCR